MIKNFSLNDNTQKEILKHLEITSKLLSKVGTELSGTQKESIIYTMPDLGIAQNGTRMLGGFYTGACYSWDSDIPFIPVDATVNVCGTTVYRLKHKIAENIRNFFGRVYDFLDSIKNEYNGKRILIVAHGGNSIPIKCYFDTSCCLHTQPILKLEPIKDS